MATPSMVYIVIYNKVMMFLFLVELYYVSFFYFILESWLKCLRLDTIDKAEIKIFLWIFVELVGGWERTKVGRVTNVVKCSGHCKENGRRLLTKMIFDYMERCWRVTKTYWGGYKFLAPSYIHSPLLMKILPF